jgi:hypothetical protein
MLLAFHSSLWYFEQTTDEFTLNNHWFMERSHNVSKRRDYKPFIVPSTESESPNLLLPQESPEKLYRIIANSHSASVPSVPLVQTDPSIEEGLFTVQQRSPGYQTP